MTVYTPANVLRLGMLREQCASYRGPLAAAVHVPLVQQETHGLTPTNRRALLNATMAIKQLFQEWV